MFIFIWSTNYLIVICGKFCGVNNVEALRQPPHFHPSSKFLPPIHPLSNKITLCNTFKWYVA